MSNPVKQATQKSKLVVDKPDRDGWSTVQDAKSTVSVGRLKEDRDMVFTEDHTGYLRSYKIPREDGKIASTAARERTRQSALRHLYEAWAIRRN